MINLLLVWIFNLAFVTFNDIVVNDKSTVNENREHLLVAAFVGDVFYSIVTY